MHFHICSDIVLSNPEILNFFEDAGTFGILTQGGGCNYKFVIVRGRACHKIATMDAKVSTKCQVVSYSLALQAALFNKMPLK